MNGILLDTHAWLWLQKGVPDCFKDSTLAEIAVQQKKRTLFVSAISILELARLESDGKYDPGTTIYDFVEKAKSSAHLEVLDLTTRVLIESTRLPGKIHRDPADRILVATAREYGLTLLTADKLLFRYAAQGHLNIRKL